MKDKQIKRGPIVATSYHKKQTGRKNNKGKNEWETVAKSSKLTGYSSFSKLKQKTYEDSQKNKSIYVSYKPHIVSVTKKLDDGTKIVTYFNRVRSK